MSVEIPEDCRFLESHEWAREVDDRLRVGISEFAQDELGDVVYVELPDEGEAVEAEAAFGVVESIKAISDIYAPVSGTVVAANDDLVQQPELVNEDPYGDGWMIEIEPDDSSALEELLSPSAYRDRIA